MSDAVKIALIISIAPTLTAAASLVVSLRNRARLEGLHKDLNSRLTELLNARGASERAMGVSEGRAQGVAERAGRVAEEERVEDRVAKRTER